MTFEEWKEKKELEHQRVLQMIRDSVRPPQPPDSYLKLMAITWVVAMIATPIFIGCLIALVVK